MVRFFNREMGWFRDSWWGFIFPTLSLAMHSRVVIVVVVVGHHHVMDRPSRLLGSSARPRSANNRNHGVQYALPRYTRRLV
jgi:hypothetical protein